MSVPLARRNLFHDKGKLILSVTGVAATLALVLLLLGFRTGLYATLTAFVDNVGADVIVAQSGAQGMFASDSAVPLALHDDAANAANAREAGHIIVADIIFTEGKAKTPVLLVGYDPATPFGAPWDIGEGRDVAGDDEILLDTWLAQRSGVAVGDEVEVLGRTFTVVGLTRETTSWMSPYIFVSLDAAASSLGLNNIVSYHLLRLPAGADTGQAIAAVEAEVPGVDALTPAEVAEADARVLATVMDTPLTVMLVIGVVIGATVMGLTAYTAVTDQMREYGVLKAVGADASRLARLVTAATLYRAVMGFALGVALAYGAAQAIMALWPQFTVVIRSGTILLAGALAVVMTVLAALLPLYHLHRIDPMLVFRQ